MCFPEPNINFPAVLAGNEDESLEYIEKFSENRRAYVIHYLQPRQKYFPKISAILKNTTFPDELKMLHRPRKRLQCKCCIEGRRGGILAVHGRCGQSTG